MARAVHGCVWSCRLVYGGPVETQEGLVKSVQIWLGAGSVCLELCLAKNLLFLADLCSGKFRKY